MITNPRKYIILQDVNNTEYRFDHLSNINPELDGIGKIVEYSNGWVTENGYTYEDGPLCKFRIRQLLHWDLNILKGVYAICESNPSIGMRLVYVGRTGDKHATVVKRFNYGYGYNSRRMNEHSIYINKNILKSLKSGNTLAVYFLTVHGESKRNNIEISIIHKNSSPYLWNRTGNNRKSSSSTNNRKPPKPPNSRKQSKNTKDKPKKEWESFEAKERSSNATSTNTSY